MFAMSRRLLPTTTALAAFDAVARHQSFSLAADELSLTQSAISRQILILEEQLGVKLFERTSRKVMLTLHGVNYWKSISPALTAIRTASLNIISQSSSRTLNLAFLPTFGTRWLIPRIPNFVAKHPDIILNFATRIGQFDFDREGLDAAIHTGQPDWPDAEHEFLMEEQVVPVCSPQFLKTHMINSPEDLAKLPLFHMSSRPGAWQQWFADLNLDLPINTAMRFEQFSNVAQACIAGIGVALMPLFLIQSELNSGQLVTAWNHSIKSPNNYYFVAPKSRWDFDAIKAFREWLLEEVKNST